MTMLTRYGYRGNNLKSLYKMIKAVNQYRKNMRILAMPNENFFQYGKIILKFLDFLNLVPQFRNIPHFILNWNSASKVQYCIYSIQKIEKLYLSAKRSENQCLFNNHEKYVHNITSTNKTHAWTFTDDFLLLSR